MRYIISEIQTNGTSVSTLTWDFSEERDAWAKYYSVLAVACKSGLTKHAAIFYTNEGTFVEGKCFSNEPPAEE